MRTLKNDNYENILHNEIDYFGYIVNKSNYDLLYVNYALLSQLSKVVPDLHNYHSKKCYNALHNLDEPCKHCNLNKITMGERHKSHYYNELHETWFSVIESIVEKDDMLLFCRNSFNIADEIQEVGNLKEIISKDKVVITCAQTLLNNQSFDSSINTLLEVICDYFGGEYACLFERDYENHVSNVTFKYHVDDVKLIKPEYTRPFTISSEDTWTNFLRKKNYAYLQSTDDIDETLINSNYYNRFVQSDRDNLLVVSLNDNGNILGAIEIDNVTKNTKNLEFITTITAFIITILHIKNTTQQLEEKVTDLNIKDRFNKTILKCVKTLVYGNDTSASLYKLLEIIAEYFGSSVTNILYKDHNSDMLICNHSFTNDDSITNPGIRDFPASRLIKLYYAFERKEDGVSYISSVREMGDYLNDTFNIEYDSFKRKNIKSLLCAPLIENGEIVGFIAVQNPSKNLDELHLVRTMSAFVVNHITKSELLKKLEKLSYVDSLTNTYNRNFYNNYIEEFNINPTKNIGILFADVNGLKKANDNFGHELGDALIRGSANFLKRHFNGLIFRIGGDEFVCIMENITENAFLNIFNDINTTLFNFDELHMSIGKAWELDCTNIETLIGVADTDMYNEKKNHYKRSQNDERTVKQYLIDLKKSIEQLHEA